MINGPLPTPPLEIGGSDVAVEDDAFDEEVEAMATETIVLRDRRRPMGPRSIVADFEPGTDGPFVPSLTTIEKTAAAKVFFENHYCPS